MYLTATNGRAVMCPASFKSFIARRCLAILSLIAAASAPVAAQTSRVFDSGIVLGGDWLQANALPLDRDAVHSGSVSLSLRHHRWGVEAGFLRIARTLSTVQGGTIFRRTAFALGTGSVLPDRRSARRQGRSLSRLHRLRLRRQRRCRWPSSALQLLECRHSRWERRAHRRGSALSSARRSSGGVAMVFQRRSARGRSRTIPRSAPAFRCEWADDARPSLVDRALDAHRAARRRAALRRRELQRKSAQWPEHVRRHDQDQRCRTTRSSLATRASPRLSPLTAAAAPSSRSHTRGRPPMARSSDSPTSGSNAEATAGRTRTLVGKKTGPLGRYSGSARLALRRLQRDAKRDGRRRRCESAIDARFDADRGQ